MRVYFAVISVLFAMVAVTSYKIVAAVHLDRWDENTTLRSVYLLNDNGTSDRFEQRYSPQIRECGGLLKYSPGPLRQDDAVGPSHRGKAFVRTGCLRDRPRPLFSRFMLPIEPARVGLRRSEYDFGWFSGLGGRPAHPRMLARP